VPPSLDNNYVFHLMPPQKLDAQPRGATVE
jgi:hypothetical protein